MENLIIKRTNGNGVFYNQEHLRNGYKIIGEIKDDTIKSSINTNITYNIHFVGNKDTIIVNNCILSIENDKLLYKSKEYAVLK